MRLLLKRRIYKAVKNDEKITVKNKMTKKEIDSIRDYCCSRYIEESYMHDINTSTADAKLFTVLWNENVIFSNLIN